MGMGVLKNCQIWFGQLTKQPNWWNGSWQYSCCQTGQLTKHPRVPSLYLSFNDSADNCWQHLEESREKFEISAGCYFFVLCQTIACDESVSKNSVFCRSLQKNVYINGPRRQSYETFTSLYLQRFYPMINCTCIYKEILQRFRTSKKDLQFNTS